MVDPCPRAFVRPAANGRFCGVVFEAGTRFEDARAERLGTGGTSQVAAGLDGTGDVIAVGSRVRYGIAGKNVTDLKRHEMCAAHDAEMKRNGDRLLELTDIALRRFADRGCTDRIQAVVRWFPCVAFRHPRVAAALDRLPEPDQTIRRWFGLKAGRGRPARSVAEARAVVGTLIHECGDGEKVEDAFERLEQAGMGARESLANRRSSEGELYQLSVGGIWVKANVLRLLPWVRPGAAAMRWDVYGIPA